MNISRFNPLCVAASRPSRKSARLWAIATTALLLAVAPFSTHAQAQEQSVRVVVPYGPGGTSDITARVLQAPLAKALGQNVVVENKAGAAGTVAARYVAGARPDGQTLLIPNSANTLAPLLQEGQPFDYAANFVPVSRVASAPMVMLVSPAILTRRRIRRKSSTGRRVSARSASSPWNCSSSAPASGSSRFRTRAERRPSWASWPATLRCWS